MCLAAMLASIASSIYGLHSQNETIVVVGTICGIVSSAIYAGCEAYVDASATTKKTINVSDNGTKEN